MKFPRQTWLIASFAFVCFAFLEAESPLAEKWFEVTPPPQVSNASTRRNAQLPLPTPSATPPIAIDPRPTATFRLADSTQIKAQRDSSGRFPLVELLQREVVNIALEFPASLTSALITAQPLDGGKIISLFNNSNQPATIRFQVGNQPGLYRVRVQAVGESALLQFWVADPKNPKAKPPVINPGH